MNFKTIVEKVVANETLHAKFLNTLSLMENTGARKISASEHKTKVNYIILKHACEEARHAFYLKKQIQKITSIDNLPTYENQYLLAPLASREYLMYLDIRISRYLKNTLQLTGYDLKYAAYLLVTYAIEVRADELYPIYQEILDKHDSKVNVKSIILEEEGHLEEMMHQMKEFSSDWETLANKSIEIEKVLFDNWVADLGKFI
ncbi:MAG: hypothetical protein KA313_03860 [Pseudarcicella sp.]|nr:hypothetical protein [Pseudarcicella sp.]MBP6410211.1 hypothetical protein [Pseudarcicella sp.]